MAAIPISVMKLYLFSSLIPMVLLSITTTISAASNQTQPRRYAIKLIHRDSIFSPFYNPNATIADRARKVRERSIARLEYLARTSSLTHIDDVRGRIIAVDGGNIFLVKLSIGVPKVEQLVGMDTGSNLVWVQCQPCINCFKQYSPIFDPSNSYTYRNVTCNNCPYSCDSTNHCHFSFGYLDNSSASGVIALETFSGFFTSDEGISSVPSVVFGCAYDNQGSDGEISGLLGLGPYSGFLNKLGPKFSYCIGNINDPKYPHSVLVLGDAAITQGDSTPLEVYGEFYHLTMESVSVGDKVLNIDPKIFQRDSQGRGGVVIDSGATHSYLAEGAFQALSNEVRSLLDRKFQRLRDPREPSNLCYEGDVKRDLVGFPAVTYNFAGGAKFTLDTESFFHAINTRQFCISVHQSIPNLYGKSIIGAMAQQYYNVGFDINGKKLTIQRIDCQLLDS